MDDKKVNIFRVTADIVIDRKTDEWGTVKEGNREKPLKAGSILIYEQSTLSNRTEKPLVDRTVHMYYFVCDNEVQRAEFFSEDIVLLLKNNLIEIIEC